jgi:hypothetical protein
LLKAVQFVVLPRSVANNEGLAATWASEDQSRMSNVNVNANANANSTELDLRYATSADALNRRYFTLKDKAGANGNR